MPPPPSSFRHDTVAFELDHPATTWIWDHGDDDDRE